MVSKGQKKTKLKKKKKEMIVGVAVSILDDGI